MKTIIHSTAVLVWTIFPALAQNLTGTVTAADTGAPLPGVTVTAILTPATAVQRPAVYQLVVASSGAYAITALPGQYSVCARPQLQSLYLDPCQWGTPINVTLGATAVPVPISLQPGLRFLVRVHDPNQLLSQAETIPGAAVSAFVTNASIAQFPLAVVYSDSLVRDYGTVVPMNTPLSVTISSATLVLTDATGAALAPSAISLQALATDVGPTAGPPPAFAAMFPPPDAKIVHVYATALR